MLLVAAFLLALLSPAPARAEGFRGYGAVEGALGFVSGIRTGDSSVAPGGRLEFGVGTTSLPLTIGLAYAFYILDHQTNYRTSYSNGVFGERYHPSRSLELRQLEAVVRLQPDWPKVRPFVSASVGYVGAWYSQSQPNYAVETSLDGALVRGVAIGVDLDPWTKSGASGRRSSGAVVLTIGLRGSETGQLDLRYPDVPTGSLRVIAPFIALTIAGWS